MSLADDLRGKLDAATGELASLQLRLNEIVGLEESLRDANGQLFQTSSRVSELTVSARAAQESLDLTVKALERATDVMMRLEPAVITSAIQEADTSIKAAIEDSSTKLTESVSQRAEAIEQSINTSQATTRQQVTEQEARQAERHAYDVRVFKWIGAVGLLSIAVLVVLAVLILLSVR